jgi:hypothetical protein
MAHSMRNQKSTSIVLSLKVYYELTFCSKKTLNILLEELFEGFKVNELSAVIDSGSV